MTSENQLPPLDQATIDAETIRYLLAENARLKKELAAAQAGPVVMWQGVDGDYTMSIGNFSGSVSEDSWSLELRTYLGSRGVEGGPETGAEGKAKCEAAYRRATGLVQV